MKTRKISDFLNNELKEYANDVLTNRALPSCIDSFKPTQRKIIWTAINIWKTGNEKPVRVFSIVGSVSSFAYYHHGDVSCSEAVCNMNQTFKNNLPLLEGFGQYGSLRNPFHAQSRYISTKLHPNFKLVYKDFELLENQIDEGVVIEPKYLLPILPVIIINSNMGIGMAYSSNILGRNPKEVLQGCIDYLNGKKVKELKPYMTEFSGEWIRDTENRNKWYSKGTYEIIKNDVHITELPPDWTFEKYESYLDSLVDNKIIKDYDNNSASFVDYTLKFRKEDLQNLIDTNKLESVLKLTSSVVENFTTLDENSKLKIFDSAEDILKYFVDFRIKYYQKRKDYLIDKYKKELTELCWRAKFIKSIIDKKLVVNNKPKDEIVKWLEENKFEKMNGDYGYLLSMQIYSLTKERYDDLMDKAKQKKENLEDVMKKEPKEMYLEDLQDLKKKL